MGWTPHPTEIRYVSDEDALHVTFSDGMERDYPTAFLRGFCPCAHCQGHGNGPPKYVPPATDAATRVENVTPVGNYALCIVWGDGHDTGIFSFELLRQMEPPDDFDVQRMEAGTPLDLG